MSDKSFIAKNGITANTTFTANSTLVQANGASINSSGAYISGLVNAASFQISSIFVANTIAFVANGITGNSSGIYVTGLVNAASHTTGGGGGSSAGGLTANATTLMFGNTIANVTISNTNVSLANGSLLIATSAMIANSLGVFTTGTVNATVISTSGVTVNTIGVFTTGTVNAATISTSGITVNTTAISLGSNIIRNFVEDAMTLANAGPSITLDSARNVQRLTLNSASCTITLPSSMPGKTDSVKTIVLYLKQDGTGGRAITLTAPVGESIQFNNASTTQPPIATGASKVTIFVLTKFDGDSVWYVSESFVQA